MPEMESPFVRLPALQVLTDWLVLVEWQIWY
jgi:hypothetical protein